MILGQLFPLLHNVRVTTDISFNNIIISNNNTSEQRVIQNEYPLRQYSLYKNILTDDELSSLRNFYQTAKGSYNGFLFEDPLDNFTFGVVTQVYEDYYHFGTLFPVDQTLTKFVAAKVYQIEGSQYAQPIYWPINIVVYQNGSPITTPSYTLENGTITFSSALSGTLTADFSFYIPVRFKDDIFLDKIIARNIGNTKTFQLLDLELIEVKPNLDAYPASIFNEFTGAIKVDLRWGQESQIFYNTSIFETISQKEARKQQQSLSESYVNLRTKSIVSKQQIRYLIALWLNLKGNGRVFKYLEATSDTVFDARFDSNTLTIVNQSATLVHELQPIGIKLFKNGQIVDRIAGTFDPETYILFIYDTSTGLGGGSTLITATADAVRQVLIDTIYEGDTAKGNEYVRAYAAATEDFFSRFLGLNPVGGQIGSGTGRKYIVFYFQDEADSGFHSVPRNVGNEPTPTYVAAFNSFLADLSNVVRFRATMFVPSLGTASQTIPWILPFRNFMADAIAGNNGYAPLANYNIGMEEIDPDDSELQQYYVDFALRNLGLTGISLTNTRSAPPEIYLCYLLKITTPQGDIFGYTSHDKDLLVQGITFKASGALSPTAYASKSDLSLDSVKIEALFIDFDETLLFSGVLNGAEVDILVVDWLTLPQLLDPTDLNVVDFQRGILGEIVSQGGNYYSVEFLSFAASKLNQTYVSKTQSNCPYQFMSEKCGYPYTEWTGTVNADVVANWVSVTGNYDANLMRGGRLIFTSGELKGATFGVNHVENGDRFIFTTFLLRPPMIGDTVILLPGCIKTEQACKDYSNFINFGGIPTGGGWMPGNYYLLNAPRS